jgi:XTP/dITP diphosphohydrolase
VYSARYAGPDGDAVANRALLLKEMRGQRNRSARFRTVLAFKEGSEVLYFEGMCEGALLDEERGEGGFGYDALFVPAGEDRTFAEMDGVSKNRISHRGIALRAFKKYMAERSKAG